MEALCKKSFKNKEYFRNQNKDTSVTRTVYIYYCSPYVYVLLLTNHERPSSVYSNLIMFFSTHKAKFPHLDITQ